MLRDESGGRGVDEYHKCVTECVDDSQKNRKIFMKHFLFE